MVVSMTSPPKAPCVKEVGPVGLMWQIHNAIARAQPPRGAHGFEAFTGLSILRSFYVLDSNRYNLFSKQEDVAAINLISYSLILSYKQWWSWSDNNPDALSNSEQLIILG